MNIKSRGPGYVRLSALPKFEDVFLERECM